MTPHRSCGIALAATFGRPTAPYQSLRRGGITGDGPCGAIVAGQLLLGELFGDPDPTGPVTATLREAMGALPGRDRAAADRAGAHPLLQRAPRKFARLSIGGAQGVLHRHRGHGRGGARRGSRSTSGWSSCRGRSRSGDPRQRGRRILATVCRVTSAHHAESTVLNVGLNSRRSSARFVTRRSFPLKRRLAGKSSPLGRALRGRRRRSLRASRSRVPVDPRPRPRPPGWRRPRGCRPRPRGRRPRR